MGRKKMELKHYVILFVCVIALVGWLVSENFVSSYLGDCHAGMTLDEINAVGFKPFEIPDDEYPSDEDKNNTVYDKYSRTPAGRMKGGNVIEFTVCYNEDETVESVRSDVVYASPLGKDDCIKEETEVLAEFIEERALDNIEYVNYRTYEELNAFRNEHPTLGMRDALIRKDGASSKEAEYLSYYVWDENSTVTYFFVAMEDSGYTEMSFEQVLKNRR